MKATHLLEIMCVAAVAVSASPTIASAESRTYEKDGSVFSNPERGWYLFAELKSDYASNKNRWVTPELLESYELLLNLPDPKPSLYYRPDYSIRLANKGVWEPDTGYNNLGLSVVVEVAALSVESSPASPPFPRIAMLWSPIRNEQGTTGTRSMTSRSVTPSRRGND